MTEDMKEILDQPTCSVEELGRVFGISKNPAYEAVKRGDFPSIRVGGRIRIPTAPLRQMLGLASSCKNSWR
jgi:excisionase family DNA binding protein